MKKMFSSLAPIMALIAGLVLVLSIASIQGCISLEWFNKNKSPLEFAVKAAVVDIISENDIEPRRVIELADQALVFVNNNPKASAYAIMGHVRSEISWDKLTLGQTILAEALLMVLTEKIEADIEQGLIDKDIKASVKEIISWIRTGAEMAALYKADIVVTFFDEGHRDEGHRTGEFNYTCLVLPTYIAI